MLSTVSNMRIVECHASKAAPNTYVSVQLLLQMQKDPFTVSWLANSALQQWHTVRLLMSYILHDIAEFVWRRAHCTSSTHLLMHLKHGAQSRLESRKITSIDTADITAPKAHVRENGKANLSICCSPGLSLCEGCFHGLLLTQNRHHLLCVELLVCLKGCQALQVVVFHPACMDYASGMGLKQDIEIHKQKEPELHTDSKCLGRAQFLQGWLYDF